MSDTDIDPVTDFDEGNIAHCIEIQGVYDGIAVYVMNDGTWVNRFRLPGYGGWERRAQRVDDWIALNRQQADNDTETE